jgi:probable HAF family extracellular repeat protein
LGCALGINKRRQVVGFLWTLGTGGYVSPLLGRAVLWVNGAETDLGVLWGDNSSRACGINDRGQIVGESCQVWNRRVGILESSAFLWEGGNMIDLGNLGYRRSGAQAINARGQVVGWSARTGPESLHAFLWENGKMRDLGTLGGMWSRALAINEKGQVVGDSTVSLTKVGPRSERRAFLWEGGKMKDLTSLVGGSGGWVLESATGIDNLGRIVGYGLFGGEEHVFLLTPSASSRR